MKKIIDLITPEKSHKDEKLLNYIRKNYLVKNHVTNLCFITGLGDDWGHHTQPSVNELRKIIFGKNSKDTIYFLRSFFFDYDRNGYLKLMEEACENDIQFFKTDQVPEHITDNKLWTDKYCEFLSLKDIEK